MANNALNTSYNASVSPTLYATLRRVSDGSIWDVSAAAFATWADASLADYAIELASKGGDLFAADMPTGITSGTYRAQFYRQADAAPALTDTLIDAKEFYWNGSTSAAAAPAPLPVGAFTEAQIIRDARLITGNEPEASAAPLAVPDAAIRAELASVVRRVNAICGSGDGLIEHTFDATVDQQDYTFTELEAAIGGDITIQSIESVIRSGAYVSEYALGGEAEYDAKGEPVRGLSGVVPRGFQGAAMDAIVHQVRAEREAEFSWEIAPGRKLRLMPAPATAEKVSIRCTTTGASIATLPEEARSVLTMAAVVCILNGRLNRGLDMRKLSKLAENRDAIDKWLTEQRRQRDKYEEMYKSELAMLGR